MRSSVFLCILLPITLFCHRASGNDTLKLPKQNVQAAAFKTEEVNINRQKRFRILTDHYNISAVGTKAGNLAGERLEHLFGVWTLLAAEFIKEPENVPVQHRHQVVLYRDEPEYKQQIRRIDPYIRQRTNGYYSSSRKTAYFYAPESKVLLHEGTHQIFLEYFFRENKPAFYNNFWVVEGIALFMETLKIEEECYRIGNLLDDRLYAAKVYQFERNYNLPIRKLTAMSADEIQASAEIRSIYCQSAALVHWLMFAEEGCHRKHLFELLRQTYLDTAKPETLSDLTGLSYEELDKKYVEFLQTIPDEP
jgi:hypothetical protein